MLGSTFRTSMTGALTLVPLACAQPTTLQDRHPTGLGEFETRHWIHSESLRTVMAVLEREALASWPQEVETEYAVKDAKEAQKAFDEARALAGQLASSTPGITAAVKTIRMSEADRRAYAAVVDTFRDQAQRLHDAAEAGDLDRMRTNLKSIRATCTSCHERFRDLAGSIKE